ncbi:hypothetical protein A1OW_14345 [Enterovibrio norvegicus]|uniref:hypothetical protein n=1 Tax=Enterovibrio norvegicus TaxID=188144 RepID=UPI0002DE10CC|nr:hypothetical protein [Enterovibrio norvegicus]OEF48741.1 hypothetical protein A1OW_14345 [Enterovibrio norvegicus]
MYFVKKNKFRMFFNFFFWGVISFSIWTLFATSTEPVIINNSVLKFIFEFKFTGQTIIHNLAIGVVVSYIFYFIVVYLPEKKKQQDLKPLLKDKVYGIVRSISITIEYIGKYTDSDFSIFEMKKDEFIEKVGEIPAGLILCENPTTSEMHDVIQLNLKVHKDIVTTLRLIDDLQSYMPFLDSECVALLSEIRYSKSLSTLDFLKGLNTEKIKNQNLNVISEYLYQMYDLSRDLQKLNKRILGCEKEYPKSSIRSLVFKDSQLVENFQKAYEQAYGLKDVNVNIKNKNILITHNENEIEIYDIYDISYRYSDWFCIKSLLVKLCREHPDNNFNRKNKFYSPLKVEFKPLK